MTARLFIQNLAGYNAGRLDLGEWVDVEGLTGDEIAAEADRIGHKLGEEYAVHDYDEIPSTFGEWPDFDKVAEWCDAVAAYDADTVAALMRVCDVEESFSDEIENRYLGSFSSPADMAQDLVESGMTPYPEFDTGGVELHKLVGSSWCGLIDWDHVANEFHLGSGVVFDAESGTAWSTW